MSISKIASTYAAWGWAPIPIPEKSKVPLLPKWQNLRITVASVPEHFGIEQANVGVLLGEPSNGLVDVDLDCPESVLLAQRMLPATAKFGRVGKRDSHYLYYCDPIPKTVKFAQDGKTMLLELRSSGQQTIFPGSVHPSGEAIHWCQGEGVEPFRIGRGALLTTVRKLAAATLLLRLWQKGARDDIATALSGGLLREGWTPDDIDSFIVTICDAAGDKEAKARLKAERLSGILEGGREGNVPGWPKLAEIIGEGSARKLREWLCEDFLLERATREFDKTIDELNVLHAVVSVGGKVRILTERIDPKTGWRRVDYMSRSDFETMYANQRVFEGKRSISVATVWLQHPRRRQFKGIIFEPSQPNGADSAIDYFNLWQGFFVVPIPGDCSLFLKHLREVICSENYEHYNYLLALMADGIQHPNRRPGVAVVLRGKQGTGKGKAVEWYGKLFGPHFIQVNSPHQLLGNFNAHLEDKVLIFADEAFWAGDKAAEGKLKGMITEAQHVVERKGIDAIFVHNYARLIAASNHDWVVPAGFEERRFFVLDVSEARMQDHTYFAAIDAQMENCGLAALMHVLINFDLSGVNLRKIPQTKALLEQKLQSMPPVDAWWYHCLRTGIIDDESDKWRNKPIPIGDLYDLLLLHGKRNGQRYMPDLTAFTMRFRKITPTLGEKRITLPGGKRARAYELPSLADCRKHFESLLRMEIQWPKETGAIRTPSPY